MYIKIILYYSAVMNKTYAYLIGCIGTRVLLAYAAKNASPDTLRKMGYVALLPAIGFMYLYVNELRKTGFEAQGKIWWTNLRPLHSILYLLFAVYAIKQETFSWLPLALDAAIGIIVWYMHYYKSISFS